MHSHTVKTKGYRIKHTLPKADLWKFGSYLFAFAVALPVLAIVWLAFFPEENIWPHLFKTSLPSYLSQTFILMTGVGISVFLTGVSTAWLVTKYEFPLRRQFEWMLLLPLAFPAYVIAYVYTDLLEFAGPVQQSVRAIFGWKLASDYWFPNIRSIGGGILLMGLVLYPYVYLLARAAFLEQSPNLLEVGRLLGYSRFRTFTRVSLPIARPAIVVGVSLAMMETLNDFGTVDFFAIRTLTAGLYDVWLGMGNLGGAAQIACTLLTFVLLLLSLESFGRRKQCFYQSGQRVKSSERWYLSGHQAWWLTVFCAVPVIFGFFLPLGLLIDLAVSYFERSWTSAFKQYALNSILLSFTAAIFTCAVAILIVYSKRLYQQNHSMLIASRIASLGYAVPGAVLALGVLVPFAAIDNGIDTLARQWFDYSTGLMLSGTVFAVVFAYVVRFLAVSIGSIESSLSKVPQSMDMAARTLGYRSGQVLTKFHMPLIKGGVLTAGMVVFVDSMKELPATLILRPFNFETLATHVYQFASDEMIGESALGSLFIVLVGLLPVIFLSRTISVSGKFGSQSDS